MKKKTFLHFSFTLFSLFWFSFRCPFKKTWKRSTWDFSCHCGWNSWERYKCKDLKLRFFARFCVCPWHQKIMVKFFLVASLIASKTGLLFHCGIFSFSYNRILIWPSLLSHSCTYIIRTKSESLFIGGSTGRNQGNPVPTTPSLPPHATFGSKAHKVHSLALDLPMYFIQNWIPDDN